MRQPCGAREYHVRCVRSAGGDACFFETDDGGAFDCTDGTCAAPPAELTNWCASVAN
jgi:hypothetical protein